MRRDAAVPAWLVSLVIHLTVLLLLALLGTSVPGRSGSLLLTIGDAPGEEVALAEFDLSEAPASDPDDQQEAPTEVEVDLPPLVTPEALPSESDIELPDPLRGAEASDPGGMMSGRTGGLKQALLAEFGGTDETEAAVERGLRWLKRNQQRDGSWSIQKPYSDGSTLGENKAAATAMALLAFQGAGNTHRDGPYQAEVEAGIEWLVRQQDREGNFVRRAPSHQRLYAQAQCMIAVCELYAMTGDSQLRAVAQKAINHAADIQSQLGGWRYYPRQDADLSVTGWFVMGLASGRSAGLEIPDDVLPQVEYFLETVTKDDGATYAYQPVMPASPAMTAEGLLCRQYLGWERDHPKLIEGVEVLSEDAPFRIDDRNFYYWYYATQVLHHFGGSRWNDWNAVMREELPAAQVRRGEEEGSWAPQGSRWGEHGGRLYTTCMAIYCLEVYYRHLPLYDAPGR